MYNYEKKITATLWLLLAVCFAAEARTPDAERTATATVAADTNTGGDVVAGDAVSNAAVSKSAISGRYDEQSSTVLTPNQRRQRRGISQPSIEMVPKGQWIFGGTASYSTHSNDNYSFLVIEGIDSKGYTFKISPMIGYAVRSNMAVGARFIYSRSLLKIDDAKISMEDINLSVENYYALKHSYEVAAMWRQYIPLGRSKRFGLFTECQLAIGGTQAKFVEGAPVKGTYEKGYTVSLGLNPGIVAFATDHVAFELNIGVLGFNYTNTRQVHNQVTVGDRSSSYMNFKVNIFSIGVGMAFYL